MSERTFYDASEVTEDDYIRMLTTMRRDPYASNEDKGPCPSIELLVEVVTNVVGGDTAERVRSHIIDCHRCFAIFLSLRDGCNQKYDA